MTQRIGGVTPPYEPEIEEALLRWMPPGVTMEPLMLFKVLVRHPELAASMQPLGERLLMNGRLSDADRELVINRVAARSGCAYEWGVHTAVYAEAAGLTPHQITLTATGTPDDPAWSPRQRALLQAVDDLHTTAHLPDTTWTTLREHLSEEECLELLVLAGWYRTIAYVLNGLKVELEPWARELWPNPKG